MERFLGSVQKRIGLLISSIGLVVGIANILNDPGNLGFLKSLAEPTVWFIFLCTMPFIVSIFVENRIFKIIQVSVLFLMGAVNLIDAYEQFYGPAMFLVSWLLMRHYGFLEHRAKTKNAIILITLVGLSQFSAYLHTHEGLYAGLSTLLYTLFLIIVLLIIWRDMVAQQLALKKENSALRVDYNNLATQINEIEASQKPYDLKAMKISPAEERVIKTWTIYKASNREIAERLSIAESTVKLHMYNIFNKIGVDNRFAVIDLCKYNF